MISRKGQNFFIGLGLVFALLAALRWRADNDFMRRAAVADGQVASFGAQGSLPVIRFETAYGATVTFHGINDYDRVGQPVTVRYLPTAAEETATDDGLFGLYMGAIAWTVLALLSLLYAAVARARQAAP